MPEATKVEYVKASRVAKDVRAKLKEAFPKVKFYVRTHTLSGPSNITVNYKGGFNAPDRQSVHAIVDPLESYIGEPQWDSYRKRTVTLLDGTEVAWGGVGHGGIINVFDYVEGHRR